MGLDQYVYQMRKVSQKNIQEFNKKNVDDLPDGVLTINKASVDENPNMYKDILPILTPIKLVATLIDMERIKKDHNVPEYYQIGSRSCGGGSIGWGFYAPERRGYVDVTLDEDELKSYLYDEERDYYICYYKEVYYMRKHYDTQDLMYEIYEGEIENCGFHHMSQEMIEALNESEGKRVLDTRAKSLYYYEWY